MELRILESGKVLPESGCQSRTCPTGEDDYLPQSIQRRIADHPCYSDAAHHRYARMHLAVAPACNIQCNYCNRKYDCVNESRPGVVSEVLKPEDAVRKAKAVAARVPNMSVVGIAGPGDPLANAARTFETLRGVKAALPHVRLCLSTNGLTLLDHVDEIVELGVEHVTITLNAIDPGVAAKIYPWVIWDGRKIEGREGAAILIERQLLGLDALVAAGCLVKINSVLIPGVNDDHLPAVAQAVRARGAFLHNIIPLISKPEHGTAYGLGGQREPSRAELRTVQSACGVDMRLMRHCQRCRADAIGMLKQDRSGDFTMDKVAEMEARSLIAVASRDGKLVDQHFGHARTFHLFEVDEQGIRPAGTREVPPYCEGPADCDDEDDNRMERTLASLTGCAAVLCARIGREPRRQLEAAGIRPLTEQAWHPLEEALRSARQTLTETAEVPA